MEGEYMCLPLSTAYYLLCVHCLCFRSSGLCQQVCFLKLYSQLGTPEIQLQVAAFPVKAHCQAMNHATANTAKLACLLIHIADSASADLNLQQT